MRKFVIDTNALVQILGAHSKYHYLWEKFVNEEFALCVSSEVLLEYEEILTQKASPIVASLFMRTIEFSENVVRKDPFYRLHLIKADPDDNKFVDCAFACQAEYIVSDDAHFRELKSIPFPKINLKTLEEFAKDL
ncbi:MAG: putative toxin-antitoxin system toxin component, PIN family [Fibrobacter sp.]|mgnify:CR=1 FL=1|nr:putative toxin-antitoxin system toxin component, PIN family [Fibrobacter sp.]